MAIENNKIENLNIDNDEISLKELINKIKGWFNFFKSKWKLIFLASFIGSLIGLTISLFEKPIYKAVLTFAMEEDKGSGGGGLSGALGLASSFGIDLGGAGGGGGGRGHSTSVRRRAPRDRLLAGTCRGPASRTPPPVGSRKFRPPAA